MVLALSSCYAIDEKNSVWEYTAARVTHTCSQRIEETIQIGRPVKIKFQKAVSMFTCTIVAHERFHNSNLRNFANGTIAQISVTPSPIVAWLHLHAHRFVAVSFLGGICGETNTHLELLNPEVIKIWSWAGFLNEA